MAELKDKFGDRFSDPDGKNGWKAPTGPRSRAAQDYGGDGYPGGGGYPSGNGGNAGGGDEEGGLGMMECAVQLVSMNPSGFMMCSMQAMTYCIDMMRSML